MTENTTLATQEQALQLINPLAPIKENITELVESAAMLTISNDDEKEVANVLLKQIQGLDKTLTDQSEEIYKPYYNLYKVILDEVKNIRNPLDRAKDLVKKKLVDRQKEVDKKIAEQRAELAAQEAAAKAAAAAEQKKKDDEAAAALAKVAAEQWAEAAKQLAAQQQAEKDLEEISGGSSTPLTPEMQAIEEQKKQLDATAASSRVKGIRKVYNFEIIDPMQVPRAYLVPDEKLIRQAVNLWTINIPGVKIWEGMTAQ